MSTSTVVHYSASCQDYKKGDDFFSQHSEVTCESCRALGPPIEEDPEAAAREREYLERYQQAVGSIARAVRPEYLERYQQAVGSIARAVRPIVHVTGGPCVDRAPAHEAFIDVDIEGAQIAEYRTFQLAKITCRLCAVVLVASEGDIGVNEPDRYAALVARATTAA